MNKALVRFTYDVDWFRGSVSVFSTLETSSHVRVWKGDRPHSQVIASLQHRASIPRLWIVAKSLSKDCRASHLHARVAWDANDEQGVK